MSMYQELTSVEPSKEGELKKEVYNLEETIKQQADIIEDLKKKLALNGLERNDLLRSSKMQDSFQMTQILQSTIDELRDEMKKAKMETVIVQGLLDNQKEMCRTKKKELEKKHAECETLKDELEKLQIELKSVKRTVSSERWLKKEEELRRQFQQQVVESQNKITLLNAKIKNMLETEISLRNVMDALQKDLEETRKERDILKEQRILASRDSDVNTMRRQLEEVIRSEQVRDIENRDTVMASHIEKLLSEFKRLQDVATSNQRIVEVQDELGSLRTTKIFLEKQIAVNEETTKRLNEQLEIEKHVVQEQKSKIAELEEKLAAAEKNAEITHRYLLEDISKVKQAKAKLRCEFLQLKQEYNRLLGTQGKSPVQSLNVSVSTSEESGFCSECFGMRRELNVMKARLKTPVREEKAVEAHLLDTKKEEIDEEELRIQKEVVERYKKESETKDVRIAELTKTVRVLDDQCERFLKLKKGAEANFEKAKEQLEAMRLELENAKRELERNAQSEVDIDVLRQEKDRLSKKVAYLTEELRETHTDYRAELAVMAKKLSENKRKDATENESCAIKLEQLEAEKRQLETTLRSLERQITQLEEEKNQNAKEKTKTQLEEENKKLRHGLGVAITKAEKYKEDAESLRGTVDSLKEDLKKIENEKSDANLLIEQLNQTITERERLAAYLQSQIRMKSVPKVKKSSSHSTLMSTSDVSINEVVSDVETSKMHGITGCGDEKTVALLRDTYSSANDTSGFSKGYPDLKSYPLPAPSAPAYPGTMKHDIPHRWKTYLVLKQVKCVVCLEGLSRVRHALKCTECGVLVHRGCSKTISNTCGLPSGVAEYYVETTQSSAPCAMSGWIKLWRASDRSCSKWRSAWATMDEHTIRFYDTDGLANANITDSPFLQLNLDHDQWRLHMQSVADVGVKGSLSKDSYALLIEIKMAHDTLFLLAPTTQAKQRWVRALQRATNKKMFVQRRQSSCGEENSMLLGLDAPLNLSINCAQVLDDWLLIGAQEGFFITPLSTPRVPFVVTGLTAIFHMEYLAELQMLVTISGPNRQLFALHATDVYNCFNSERPAVRPTPIANYIACHLIAVFKDSSEKVRWLCVADPDQIHILQFSSRLGIFSPFKSIPTSEPAMCLLSVPDGFVFGTDQFYYVNINEVIARPIVIPGCAPDWPLAALLINDKELLLAYHNYGVFTDVQGNRTRKENIDWSRAPLEFVYSAPFLYVVHFETLEILRVADYTGPDSSCLLEARDIYRCQNAHYLGKGRAETEVLFALSAKDRTEVHSFKRTPESPNGLCRETSSQGLKLIPTSFAEENTSNFVEAKTGSRY